ncbi:uncharacterized protein LOC129718148 [Wyeomyia smithii]|uniref:uncharacterized protein LOC129718148 n=1 Tax=Wyeomyia smithii TaxID=174621 RepID=UPI002467F941|nr:uncharacterized protein LOC129718148 [Wyeomyia smithii]
MKYWMHQLLVILVVCAIGQSPQAQSVVVGGGRAISKADLAKAEHVNRVNSILAAFGGCTAKNLTLISGTVKVVEGLSLTYSVAFVVNGTSRGCELSAWERPWLEKSDPANAHIYTTKCN